MSIHATAPRSVQAALLILLLSGASGLAAGSQPAGAQTTAADEPAYGFSDTVAVQWVGVPVEVPSTLWADRLEADAFVLLVDGESIPIHDFEGPVAEVALVYVQDLSGSMGLAGKLETSAEIFEALLTALAPEDQLGVMTFSDRSTEVTVALQPPTQDHYEQPRSWQGWGKTAIRDALLHAPQFARDGRRARTGIVLVTDGNDNASAVSSAELASVLAASAVPLYLFDLSQVEEETPAAAADQPASKQQELLSLSALARATGGATYRLTPHLTAEKAAASLIQRLGRQYWLTFPADGSTPNEAHSIHVALRSAARDSSRRPEAQQAVILHHRSHYLGGEPLLQP